jgi:hypothetical protein
VASLVHPENHIEYANRINLSLQQSIGKTKEKNAQQR